MGLSICRADVEVLIMVLRFQISKRIGYMLFACSLCKSAAGEIDFIYVISVNNFLS